MLYLDSSAIVKLVTREPGTTELVQAIRTDPEVVSSALARTEVVRAVRRSGRRAARAEAVLERIALVHIDEQILRSASHLAPAGLRTLDAIHLATALSLADDVDALVTCDTRLAHAAVDAGLEVAHPAKTTTGEKEDPSPGLGQAADAGLRVAASASSAAACPFELEFVLLRRELTAAAGPATRRGPNDLAEGEIVGGAVAPVGVSD